MIHKVNKTWENQRLAALLMDRKGAFDHAPQAKLAQRMADLAIDENLIHWTQSFLTDRWVELVINGFVNSKKKVETRIPQGSPMSLIIFLIYISGVFCKVERRIPSITCLFFMNDLGFLTTGHSVSHVGKILEEAGKIALE